MFHNNDVSLRALELCESRGGRRGLTVSNSSYGLCGRKATLNERPNERNERMDVSLTIQLALYFTTMVVYLASNSVQSSAAV